MPGKWTFYDTIKKGENMTSQKTTATPKKAPKEKGKVIYVLRLYITGLTPRSQRAVQNVKQICEDYLKGRYDLEVIDIYKYPALAIGEQIIATPTLIKKLPLPLRSFIGDLSNTEKILFGLDLKFQK
jgi:circadian clock protein KaiB